MTESFVSYAFRCSCGRDVAAGTERTEESTMADGTRAWEWFCPWCGRSLGCRIDAGTLDLGLVRSTELNHPENALTISGAPAPPCPDVVETTISFVTDDPAYSEYVAEKYAGELDD